jgi:hypothetical protein
VAWWALIGAAFGFRFGVADGSAVASVGFLTGGFPRTGFPAGFDPAAFPVTTILPRGLGVGMATWGATGRGVEEGTTWVPPGPTNARGRGAMTRFFGALTGGCLPVGVWAGFLVVTTRLLQRFHVAVVDAVTTSLPALCA